MSELENAPPSLESSSCCSPIRFFAGWLNCEDMVVGGTGETVEDAVGDYFANHADDECDDAFFGEAGTMELQIWECVNEEEAKRLGLEEDWWDDEWTFMLHKLVEKRFYKCHQEPNEDYPDLPDWVYSRANATVQTPDQKP